MPDSDRLEIRCGAGVLTILPTRLLLRGPHAWAIQRAAVGRVSCAPGDKDDYEVTLRLHDGRQFLLRGFAAADLARLATAFGDIDGLPRSPDSTPLNAHPPSEAHTTPGPTERQSPALPQAEYRPEPAGADDGDADLTPTVPMLPRVPPPHAPPPVTRLSHGPRPSATSPAAAASVGVPATAMPPKIWLPHVTLPPSGWPARAEAARIAPDDAERGAHDEAARDVPAAAPRPPTPTAAPADRTGAAPPHTKGGPNRAFWP